MLQTQIQTPCASTQCKVNRDANNQTVMSIEGLYFNALSPGPTGKSGTVGFELVNSPGYFLRDYHQQSYVDPHFTSRGWNTWSEDATFWLRRDTLSAGFYTIQNSKNGRFYHSVSSGAMRFDSGDTSELFKMEASFKLVEGTQQVLN